VCRQFFKCARQCIKLWSARIPLLATSALSAQTRQLRLQLLDSTLDGPGMGFRLGPSLGFRAQFGEGPLQALLGPFHMIGGGQLAPVAVRLRFQALLERARSLAGGAQGGADLLELLARSQDLSLGRGLAELGLLALFHGSVGGELGGAYPVLGQLVGLGDLLLGLLAPWRTSARARSASAWA